MSKRRTHSPEFKARVAMEAISGRKTLQEIAADHAIHPIQVSQWKKQLLEGSSELFTRGKFCSRRPAKITTCSIGYSGSLVPSLWLIAVTTP